ncbi:MAG: hypothetical protein ABEH56_03865 [Salinirussus sp.]
MSETTTTSEPFRIVDEDAAVTVRKVFTRMGERLEVTTERLGRSVRLDAIVLESVTWQDAEVLARRGTDLGGPDSPRRAPEPSDGGTEREDRITISSEFAQAAVEKVRVDGRPLLSIEAPKLGYSIRLPATALEWLATQDHETFTEWLETPFGPEADDH